MTETKILTCSNEDIAIAADCIKKGGIVIFPTETVYGLGADATNIESAKKIYQAKGRPSDNPLICHVTQAEEAEKYCVTSPFYYKIAEKFMPGPITVILKKRSDCIIPAAVTGGLDTIAIRVPSNETARKLIKFSGVPIAAPSANLSGTPTLTALRHIIKDMNGRVDYIIDGGDSDIGLESTVVMIKNEDELVLLRPGAVTAEQLGEICSSLTIEKAVYEKFEGRPISPGMKYRHYAPDAKVVILDGNDGDVYKFLKSEPNQPVICFDEDEFILKEFPKSFSIGRREDHTSHAHRLFAALRDLDGGDVIYVRMPAKEGIGLAVFNRLIKAAGYEIKKLGDRI